MLFKVKVLRYIIRDLFRKKGEIRAYQEKQWQSFVNRTLVKSPFYSGYIRYGKIDRNELPFMDKQSFMENFNAVNTVGIDRDEAMNHAVKAEEGRSFSGDLNGITVGLSTGTSGQRGIFLVSEDERAQWAAFMVRSILPFRPFNKQKIAFFLRSNSQLYSSVQSGLYDFSYYDIFQPLDSLIQKLNHKGADVLAAQPSVLRDLASAQAEGLLKIYPDTIISFAEVLHDDVRNYVESTFGSKITEVYQCTEGMLGYSCSEGNIHLNEENIIFEFEEYRDGLYYPVITDFTRTSQPVIKYRMTDLVRLKSTPCLCGRRTIALEHIIGRDDDCLMLKKGNKIERVYADVVRRKMSVQIDRLTDYQIVQHQLDKITLYLNNTDGRYDTLKEEIVERVKTILGEHTDHDLQIIVTDSLYRAAGQKNRYVFNQIEALSEKTKV